MVINKTTQDLRSTLALTGTTASSAQVFGYSSQDLSHIVPGSPVTVANGAVTYTYPASSITLFVVPSA